VAPTSARLSPAALDCIALPAPRGSRVGARYAAWVSRAGRYPLPSRHRAYRIRAGRRARATAAIARPRARGDAFRPRAQRRRRRPPGAQQPPPGLDQQHAHPRIPGLADGPAVLLLAATAFTRGPTRDRPSSDRSARNSERLSAGSGDRNALGLAAPSVIATSRAEPRGFVWRTPCP